MILFLRNDDFGAAHSSLRAKYLPGNVVVLGDVNRSDSRGNIIVIVPQGCPCRCIGQNRCNCSGTTAGTFAVAYCRLYYASPGRGLFHTVSAGNSQSSGWDCHY